MAIPKKDKKYKRIWQPKLPTCKHCGAFGKHYSYQCRLAPQKKLKQEAPKTKAKRLDTSRQWFIENPSDKNGQWECYLQISPECPIKVTNDTINLEHVKPKCKHPELKYTTSNIKPACQPCNKLKGPWELEELVKYYPRLSIYLSEDTLKAASADTTDTSADHSTTSKLPIIPFAKK